MLRLLTTAVHGSWDDVGDLITKANASEVEGRARALAWAASAGLITPGERAVFEQARPEELDQAAEMLRQRAAKLRGT